MASKSAVLSVRIVTDTKAGQKGLDQYESRLSKFQKRAESMAGPAALVVAGVTAGAKAAYDLAAAAEQNIGAVETVFQSAAGKVIGWSKVSAQAVGMSASAYNELAARIGGSLAAAGYSHDEMAGKTKGLIDAAADLSSVFGGSAAEAAEALGAALRGEFDSAERFGIFLNAAAVQAELAATGQDKLTGAALDAAKKQATVNLIMEQAGKYAGNFAREADTAAGAQQRAAAAAQDAAAQLGTALIPVMVAASNALAGFASWVQQNPALVQVLVVALAALAAGVLAVNGALMVWRAGIAVATAAQWAWNVAMMMNPLGLWIIAILAVIAIVVVMYQKFDWFRAGVDGIVAWISGAWSNLTGAIGGGWSAAMNAISGAASSAFNAVIEGIRNVIGWVRDAIGWLANLFNQQGSARNAQSSFGSAGYLRPAYDVPVDGQPFFITAAEPSLRLPALVGSRAGGAGQVIHTHNYKIEVNGAVDKLGTARELRKLLQQLERAEGKRSGGLG